MINCRVYSETATGQSLLRYADSTWAAAPKRFSATHDRTTLVTSEPTASAMVCTFTGRPVPSAARTASMTASVCGLRYSDMQIVGTPSVNSSTSRPVSPAR